MAHMSRQCRQSGQTGLYLQNAFWSTSLWALTTSKGYNHTIIIIIANNYIIIYIIYNIIYIYI